MNKTAHTVTEIPAASLSALDLRAEAANGGRAFRVTLAAEDGTPEAQAVEALLNDSAYRVGIAYGANATWGDVLPGEKIARLVEEALNEPEKWAKRA